MRQTLVLAAVVTLACAASVNRSQVTRRQLEHHC